jgi:Na+/H+-translocating membrane pyrophosphatase
MAYAMQMVNGLVYLLMVILAIIGAFVALAVLGHATPWIYGVALVAAAMLSMAAIVVAVNSYDPSTDNADGGSRGMAELEHEVRTITDALDALIGQTDLGKQLPDSFVTVA